MCGVTHSNVGHDAFSASCARTGQRRICVSCSIHVCDMCDVTPIYTQKCPIYNQKRPTCTHKSPRYTQKRPIYIKHLRGTGNKDGVARRVEEGLMLWRQRSMQLLEQRLAPLLQQQLSNDIHVKSVSFCAYKALLSVFRALLSVYRALLSVFRALLCVF